MCPSTTPVAEADELLPPPPPPLAAAAAAAAEEAPLADAALEDDAAVEEVAPHTSNRRAYGCSTARRPAALLWISRMPETFAPAAFRTSSGLVLKMGGSPITCGPVSWPRYMDLATLLRSISISQNSTAAV